MDLITLDVDRPAAAPSLASVSSSVDRRRRSRATKRGRDLLRRVEALTSSRKTGAAGGRATAPRRGGERDARRRSRWRCRRAHAPPATAMDRGTRGLGSRCAQGVRSLGLLDKVEAHSERASGSPEARRRRRRAWSPSVDDLVATNGTHQARTRRKERRARVRFAGVGAQVARRSSRRPASATSAGSSPEDRRLAQASAHDAIAVDVAAGRRRPRPSRSAAERSMVDFLADEVAGRARSAASCSPTAGPRGRRRPSLGPSRKQQQASPVSARAARSAT